MDLTQYGSPNRAADEYEARAHEAREAYQRAASAATDAQTMPTHANNRLKDWMFEHQFVPDAMHDAIDATVRAAADRLEGHVLDARKTLAMGQPIVGHELMAAVVDHVAATDPEFSAALHAALDADPGTGRSPTSPLDSQQQAELVKQAKLLIAAARDCATEAQAHKRGAAEAMRVLDRGGDVDLDRMRQHAEHAEQMRERAQEAHEQLRELLPLAREREAVA